MKKFIFLKSCSTTEVLHLKCSYSSMTGACGEVSAYEYRQGPSLSQAISSEVDRRQRNSTVILWNLQGLRLRMMFAIEERQRQLDSSADLLGVTTCSWLRLSSPCLLHARLKLFETDWIELLRINPLLFDLNKTHLLLGQLGLEQCTPLSSIVATAPQSGQSINTPSSDS